MHETISGIAEIVSLTSASIYGKLRLLLKYRFGKPFVMKKFFKIILPVILAFIFVSGSVSSVFAGDEVPAGEDIAEAAATTEYVSEYTGEQAWPAAPEIAAESILLVETNTDSVLNSKNEDVSMYPASTTKILTCLIALETCSLDETVTFSETAVALEEGDSNIGAVAGEQMPMRDVLFGLMVASGNECANAIAEHIGGSNEGFAEIMNAKAQELGAASSHFTNPSGLFNADHYTTARDLATIAAAAYRNSTFVDIISHRTYTIQPTNMDPNEKVLNTTVELINPTSSVYNEYVIGGKTGNLYESGRCLVSFAKKDDLSLISVLLKADYYGIFEETLKNFDYGFNNFSIVSTCEVEPRFSYMDENCKVFLDTKSEMITVNSVPFDDISAKITFVSDMDQETREKIYADVGMTKDSSLRFYALLEYYYAGHYLGNVYVLTDSSIKIQKPSFVSVHYVNVWIVLIIAVIVLVLIFILSKRPKKRRRRYRY